MSGLDIPERAYRAAIAAYGRTPVKSTLKLPQAIAAAAPAVVAEYLRRLAAEYRSHAADCMQGTRDEITEGDVYERLSRELDSDADSLDPEGANRG